MEERARRELDLYLKEKRKEDSDGTFYTGQNEEAAYEAFKSMLSYGHSGASIHITKSIVKAMVNGEKVNKPPAPKNKDEFDYYGMCYKSAIEGYHILEKGSTDVTYAGSIFVKLIDGDVLVPIENTPDIWDEGSEWGPKRKTIYQCNRMGSLFKDVDEDGKISYNDVGRIICVDINNKSNAYHSGLVDNVVNKMHPITFPYLPEKYIAYCENFLVDERNGDFDTVGIFDLDKKGGTELIVEHVNRFFKFGHYNWIEITEDEYNDRKKKGGRKVGNVPKVYYH